MNYTDDACIYEITNGQWDRINFMVSTYRPNLGTGDLAIEGCTDPSAFNYNPDATVDDGSCVYDNGSTFGDLNLDGQTNVVDVVYLVDTVLNDLEYISDGDFNNDSINNVIDIVVLVDIILNPMTVGCTDPSALNYNPNVIYDDGSCIYEGECVDIEGNSYNTVQIGNQIWMAENLRVAHYRNGNDISTGFSGSEWSQLGNTETGAFAIYDDDPVNIETYGILYNWYAVDDERGICPENWHVPTDEEFIEMEIELGMSQQVAESIGWRGSNEGGKLKEQGINHWYYPNTGATNESGFSAVPGGDKVVNGNYIGMGSYNNIWSATVNGGSAWRRGITFDNSQIRRWNDNKEYGFSVRCVGDSD
ncbi:MAG: hypothetical protein HN600_06500 [Bacteroidetes bacterium]|nr:hypothetical protein [Bacteroidota bacterium]